jgi:hypothetical protein
VSSSVHTCPFYLVCQTFWDGLELTAGLGSESSTPHFGLTLLMSLYTLHSKVVTTDCTTPGYSCHLMEIVSVFKGSTTRLRTVSSECQGVELHPE